MGPDTWFGLSDILAHEPELMRKRWPQILGQSDGKPVLGVSETTSSGTPMVSGVSKTVTRRREEVLLCGTLAAAASSHQQALPSFEIEGWRFAEPLWRNGER